MRRLLAPVLSTVGLAVVGAATAGPAFAAGITIDSPDDVATAEGGVLTILGTYDPDLAEEWPGGGADGTVQVVAYVDGVLIRDRTLCSTLMVVDPEGLAYAWSAGFSELGSYVFTVNPRTFDEAGLPFEGEHTIEMAVLETPITATESRVTARESVTVTVQGLDLRPARALGTAAAAVVLMLLVGWPGQPITSVSAGAPPASRAPRLGAAFSGGTSRHRRPRAAGQGRSTALAARRPPRRWPGPA